MAVRRTRRGFLFVIFACLGASAIGSFLTDLLRSPLSGLSDAIAITCMRGAQAAFWTTALLLTTNRLWKLGFLLLSASAIGNFLSKLYPPFAIVDYLYSAPLSRVTHLGVINLADAMFLLAIPILALSAIGSLWQWFQIRFNRSKRDGCSGRSDIESASDSAEPSSK